MNLNGIGQNYYQNNVKATKSTKSVNSTEETSSMRELSEAEEMAAFKKEFYAELERIPKNGTITNLARQMAKVSNAYDANVMTETAADSASLLG